ncbi:hypothetical protein MS3_00006418 [Schistosoma haematobium]|uniref:Uncharacterized protein n=1 Tax=Schistosoma haematobium TaxID=6185 RepID=A0A922IQX7_SCHHA|nr:hypothetical protein MS3_00006418 [Schistosoma haematobium]KAH9585027.1 hypothetical protein MS3_00006418 [Schistosoma haematobium]CAH8510823.1 unnamed protein product [Schistosoma haematobium]CAH8513905.1 unnamed protein product [Schistosoma haematobium]
MQDHEKSKENTQNSLVDVHVIFLDGGTEKFCLSERCLGLDLFTLVIKKIGTFQNEYFGLLYSDFEGNSCWVDNNKPLTKVLRNSSTRPLELLFGVKFFTPYPNLIEDDLTRYLYALQIRNDFFQGLLHSNRNTSLLLAAFIAQSQLGDFQESECRSYAYLKKHHLFRTAPDSYLMRLMELHQTLIGISKSEADYRLLDAARKVELYGIRLHAAKNTEDKPVNLGVNHFGIMIFENFSRMNTFNWSMIRKLSFKRRKLLIKLHMEAYSYGNDIIEFSFPTRNSCKNFWKKCIEQHTFFRSISPYGNRMCGTINHRNSVVFPHSFTNIFTLPFGKLHRSASCEANGLLNSKASTHKQNNEISSDMCNTKSSQDSHLSTPVKRVSHLNRSGSNSHFSSEYNSSSLKFNPYFDDRTASMRRKSHALTKLLSQQTPITGGGEHVELFRLSFTSLIPYSSLSFDSNNIPGASSTLPERSSFKWNCNRAVSTSSIDRQLSSCRRKLSTHSYVPRHFSGTISRQSSASEDVNALDWSDCKFYNQRSTLTNYNSKNSVNIFKPSENVSVCSSSCSLTSESYPRPVSADDEPLDHTQFLLTSKSDLSNLYVCELDWSADEKDTSPISVISTKQSKQTLTSQIRSPFMSSINQFNETTEIKKHHIYQKEYDLNIGMGNYPTSIDNMEQYAYRIDNQQTIIPACKNNIQEEQGSNDYHENIDRIIHNTKFLEVNESNDDICDLVSHNNSESVTFVQLSPSHIPVDLFKVFSENECNDDNEVHVVKQEEINEYIDEIDTGKKIENEYDQKEILSISGVVSVLESFDISHHHNHSIHTTNNSVVSTEPEEISLDNRTNCVITTSIISDDIVQSELIDDMESDIPSDQLYDNAADEAPESLADAISLGAISLITGLSEVDGDDNDDDKNYADDGNLYNSNKEISSNKHLSYLDSDHYRKGKHSKSLTHLSKSININNNAKSDELSVNEQSVYDLFRVKSQQLSSKQQHTIPSSLFLSHFSMDNDSSIPSALLSCKISTPEFDDTLPITKQRTLELLKITSGCLDIFKEVLLTESMYNRDLEFLMTASLDTANAFSAKSLTHWLQTRLLPILKPIIDRQTSFLHQLKITISRLKRLITKVKLLGKNILPLKSHDDNVESVSECLTVDCESPLYDMNYTSKGYFNSSESSMSHIVLKCSKNEQLSSSEISSCNVSPYFKHKHKKYGLHLTLKQLHSLSCFTDLLMNLLDQVQSYEIWIRNSADLLTELWFLAFVDILSSYSNINEESGNYHLNNNNFANIDNDNTENIQSLIHKYLHSNNNNQCKDKNLETSSAITRKVLYNLESRLSSIGSLWHYLLLPGRRFRSYCNLLQSLVNQMSTHSSSVFCKAIFGHYILSNRSLSNTLDRCERVALTLQLSIIIFPMENFLFTPNKCINENLEKDHYSSCPNTTHHNNNNSEQVHHNDTSGSDKSADLMSISSFLQSSIITHPIIHFGWLNKYSRRGFQPRLVFLFTDRLIYTSRIRGVTGLYLKLHAIITLSNVILEKNISHENQTNSNQVSDSMYLKFGLVVTYTSRSPVRKLSGISNSCPVNQDDAISNCSQVSKMKSQCYYRLRKHRKRFIFGVQNELDYEAWINNISKLSGNNTTNADTSLTHRSDNAFSNHAPQSSKYTVSGVTRLRDSSISKLIFTEITQRCLANDSTYKCQSESVDIQHNSQTPTSLIPTFQNCFAEHCWRQHASISSVKLLNTIDNEMSGYLFRLSKRGTSSKQKLWTILSDMCLKFYNTYNHHKLLARLWLSTNRCTVELISTNSLLYGECSTRLVDVEHDQQRQHYRVLPNHIIKISVNTKDYYFQAENVYLLKRWFNSISNILTCSSIRRNSIQSIMADNNLVLFNDALSTSSTLLSTSNAKLIFTCKSNCSDHNSK